MTIDLRYAPTPAHVGQEVVFDFVITDDAHIDRTCGSSEAFGDAPTAACRSKPRCGSTAYGPWAPPAPEPDQWMTQKRHTYTEPGRYAVVFEFSSVATQGPCSQPSPYASTARVASVIDVTVS
jgi:hypothetical protein